MLEAFGMSDPGCVRTNNEDYFVLAPSMDVFLVADGMGGALAGEHASRLAGETVLEYMKTADERTPDTLLQAVAEAKKAVRTFLANALDFTLSKPTQIRLSPTGQTRRIC